MPTPKTDAERKAEFDLFGVGVLGWEESTEDYLDITETADQYECFKDKNGDLVLDENGGLLLREDFSPSTKIEQALMVLDEYNKTIKDADKYVELVYAATTQEYAIRVGENLKLQDAEGYFFKSYDCALKIMLALKEVEGG